MNKKKKATDLQDQSQWEFKERIVATYHFELPKMTALMSAALKGQLKTVQFLLLLQKKSDIFLKDDDGETALTYAVRGRNIEIIKLFLRKGLNIDGTGCGGWSPLMTAINAYMGKDIAVIQFLLDNKAYTNYQDENGETALMLAVDFACALSEVVDSATDNLDIIKLLIKNGADVNLKNSKGFTALDKAASYENQSVINYLLAQGAKGKK